MQMLRIVPLIPGGHRISETEADFIKSIARRRDRTSERTGTDQAREADRDREIRSVKIIEDENVLFETQ